MTDKNPGLSCSKIQCYGGPKEGTYPYGNPLPKVVVFVDLNAGIEEIYLRKGTTKVYKHFTTAPRSHCDD